MLINRRERKAVRQRNYVAAQYYKVQHMKRQVGYEVSDLASMTNNKCNSLQLWLRYSK